jgi:outer membrane receptor protein involved in Fe transport
MKINKILIIILLICTSLVFSQEKGSIRGLVKDKDTGEPLIGANILLKGTYHGSSTDIDGFFLISDIKPGEFLVEVSFIGYKVLQKPGVKVIEGETVTLDVELESTALALGQEVIVLGEKPLINIEETSTIRGMSSDDIQKRVVNDAMDLISQQVGVIEQDNEIHIRGGRSYENEYLLDGLSVQDPLSGTGFGLNISANALEEVEIIAGGFKAEYGQATSGIVSVRTKSGSDRYEGYFSYRTDHAEIFKDSDFSFNTDIMEFNLGGPEPISRYLLPSIGLNLPGKFYFFLNFYGNIADDYTGSTSSQLQSSITPISTTAFSPRQNNNWSGLFKLTWKMTPIHSLVFAYNRSIFVNQNTQSLQTTLEFVEPNPGFPYRFSKNLDNFNSYTHDNEQASLTWQHALSKTTFYELRASRLFSQLRSDWLGNLWNEYARAVDVPRLPVQYFYPTGKVRVIPGDGFYDYGNASFWHDHYVEQYSFRGDITSRIGRIHTLKGGFLSNFNEFQVIDITDPFSGDFGTSQDIYRVNPADGAFYIQDDINFEGFYISLGTRLDYWFPGSFVDNAIEDTTNALTPGMRQKYMDDTNEIFGHLYKLRLMPRLGVSFPISDNQMLYFNYGHFSKLPKPQFVYAKLGPTSLLSSFQTFGNPSLNPETSVKYELGVRHKWGQNAVISITAYYKDIFDYVQTTTIRGIPRIGSGIFYINLDYARSRGMEIEFKNRIGRYLFGDISGSFSTTTTKSSSPDVGLLVSQGSIDEEPIKEVAARWDRPWQIFANLAVNIPRGDHPRVLGIRVFSNWDLNFRFVVQAGKRYTPTVFTSFDPANGRPLYDEVDDQSLQWSEVCKTWKWLDFRFMKYFNV